MFGALSVLAATPAVAQDGDDGDGGQPTPPPLLSTPKADPETVLSELETLAGTSIAAATNDPDNPYAPFPIVKSFGPDGTDASAEANTRLTSGALVSEIVLATGDVRSVASVKAQVCPDAGGKVSAKITMSIGQASGDRTLEATATGTSNNSAALTSVKVRTTPPNGAEAKLLETIGKSILRQAEQGWRNGYCVKIDVSEGQSRSVTPKEKVPISATAKQRFDGAEIKGPMTSKKTAGKKAVAPSSVSSSPAKFTYTAPDKKHETGSVELKSVSKRGIGTANLEYTTEGDLKIEGVVGTPGANVTAVKCGGPVGAWDLAYTQPATLSDLGSAPVTVGTFCTNGAPPGG